MTTPQPSIARARDTDHSGRTVLSAWNVSATSDTEPRRDAFGHSSSNATTKDHGPNAAGDNGSDRGLGHFLTALMYGE